MHVCTCGGQRQEFIHNKEYKETVEKIRRGILFAPPKKAVISKMHSNKKRIVYTYSREENYVLKLITYLLRDSVNVEILIPFLQQVLWQDPALFQPETV